MAPTERLVAAGFTGKVVAGRYKLDRMLGAGAVGEVWLAEHVHMRKRYAMKLLDARIATPEIVARFEREAVAAANVVHPSVAAGTDFGRDEDGAFFLVLEYVEGRSLRAVIKEGPISPARALHIARQVLGAAGAAHAKGVVHRDLKPENVMLAEKEGADPRAPRPKDVIKVLDFGIAKVDPATLGTKASIPPPPGNKLTRAGAVYGTPIYMAPEQALGESVDARADLYAVGVIVFELIAGKPPFEGEPLEVLAHQVNEDSPALSSKTNVPITPEIDAFVAALLTRERDKRPADVAAALALLDEAERSLATALTTPAEPIVPPKPPFPRKRLLWIGAAALLLIVPLAIVLATRAPVEDEPTEARPKRRPPALTASPSTSVSASASVSASSSSSAVASANTTAKPATAGKKSNEKGFGKLKGLFK